MTSYIRAGVDEEREQLVLNNIMKPILKGARASSPLLKKLTGLATGHFATFAELSTGGRIAMTTDGVGTKILVAREMDRYVPIGIDCVANNVNDLLCIGADPLILLDYIAIDRIDEQAEYVLGELATGLATGASEAGIEIAGGEIAQVGSLLAATNGGPPMFDIVGTGLGAFPPNREALQGDAVRPGDVIIGLPSSGLHSNGYSLARHALFEIGGLSLSHDIGHGQTIGDALLEPTRIYVPQVQALWKNEIDVHGLVNVSGGGLLNLSRMKARVNYAVEALPPPAPIFQLIQEAAAIEDAVMYATLNMGIGMCVIVGAKDADRALHVLRDVKEVPFILGHVQRGAGRSVRIVERGLVGTEESFEVA